MLTKLEVYSSRPSAPAQTINTDDSITDDPIQIRKIDGLNPVNANIVTTQYSTVDGESYNSSSIGKRNIVLTVGLNPNWQDQTMASLRKLLYAYFMPKQGVTLRFFSTLYPTTEISGIVESMDPNIFSSDPEMVVSIICPKPDFVDINPTVVTGVAEGTPEPITFDYIGSVSTGFLLKVARIPPASTYSGPLSVLNLGMTPQLIEISLVVVGSATHLELSTAHGEKYAHLVNNDASFLNILRFTSNNMRWARVDPGENVFSVTAGDIAMSWELTYYNRFGGL